MQIYRNRADFRSAGLSFFSLAVVALALLGPPASGQTSGRYRIELTSGRFVEGEVKELPDGRYEVKTRSGITVKVQKNQVRSMRPLAESPEGEGGSPSGNGAAENGKGDPFASAEGSVVSDKVIEELLAGITANPDESAQGAASDELMAELPLNTDSLLAMMQEAGVQRDANLPFEADRHPNVLITPHFVMVYTSPKASAKSLGSRLEAVWRWNVQFLRMMKVPARRPDYKLEMIYFGDWKEFDRYSRNQGMSGEGGILGYYKRDINRSHFFDFATWPPVKSIRDSLKTMQDYKARQYAINRMNRMIEHQNVEVIQHETGHHIHFNTGLFAQSLTNLELSAPTWLTEGTAMLFEVPPGQGGAGIGTLNHSRLFQFREFLAQRPLSDQEWKLFILDRSYWYGGGGWDVGKSYALGWGLVYYLFREHRDGLTKYLQQVFGREETLSTSELEKEFVECFGELNEKWFKDFRKFIDEQQLAPSAVNPDYTEAARAQNLARQQLRRQIGPAGNGATGGGVR